MLRNYDWYNRNESRSWPLDEAATLVDDSGTFLPGNILADLNLWFPDSLGQRAYVSAVTVSPTLVTLVILSGADGNPAIAAVSLMQPVVPYQQYALEPKTTGVGGWVVFGSRVNDVATTETYRFTAPTQSLLLARTAMRYTRFPVSNVAKINTKPAMTGIVNLKGGADVVTAKERRTINGTERDVAVIRLRDKTTAGEGRNVAAIYAGPCGTRPESGNCGDPQPIEFINEVPPDCCGRIYIEVRGCAEIFEIANEDIQGVVLDCGFGLADACTTEAHLPDQSGRLPNEYDDLCYQDESPAPLTMQAVETASEEFLTILDLMQPDVDATAEGLPFEETFATGEASAFTVDSGAFQFAFREVVSGPGYGGTVFYMSLDDDGKCYLKFGEEHGLKVGERFATSHVVDGKQVLMEHAVAEVENDVALFSKTKKITDYDTPPTHGAWIKITGANTGPSGGGFGLTDLAMPHPEGTWYETDEINLLSPGDKVVVVGNNVDHYNTSQLIKNTYGNDFLSSLTPLGEGGRSAWTIAMARGGGAVLWIRDNKNSELRVACEDYHGLSGGDTVVIASRQHPEYTQLHWVRRTLSPTEFVIGGQYVGNDDGIWYLVRSGQEREMIYESDPFTRAVSLWTDGTPKQPNWTCFHKQIAVTVRFKPMGASYRLNGGLAFNYHREDNQRSYMLLELDNDAGKLLRLWQVKNNAWTLWEQKYIPDLNVEMAYRLTVDVLPFSAKTTDAFIAARLDGFEQETQYQLEPRRIPQFAPSTGLIGVHANRSRIQFNNFSVKHID